MASSLAFWLEKKPNKKPNVNMEVHINYWSLPKDEINFLDIGIKLTKVNYPSSEELSNRVNAINVYLPFDSADISYDSELGHMVCKDQELLSAIFNTYIEEYSHVNDSGIHNIRLPDGKELSFYTQIEPENGDGLSGVIITEVKDKKECGTLLSFPAELFDSNITDVKDAIYFRFRIKLLRERAIRRISTITKPELAVLLGDLHKIETIDFRINEARNLPFKVRPNVNSTKSLHVVHFFLIREAISEFKASHSNYERCRLLETEIWDKYLGLKDAKSQYLIYHWKEKKDGVNKNQEEEKSCFIDHFSAFAKFTSNIVSLGLIFRVIAVTFCIGVFSGVAANLMWHSMTSNEQIEWKIGRIDSMPVSEIDKSEYWPSSDRKQ
ncbi:hypothetical protein [Vibrio scophthalmi]|uniref:Uncharacterized protein n=1 Tax=Vibrio scophthalmi TaxID=45658 RepID=A0A1E3WEV9_9VIBR|nr:hypothetical protein [Vibrio scophthalmi]ODS04280.1 hypothetical protein VSF3289_03411 [Vibrio scophthalmi]